MVKPPPPEHTVIVKRHTSLVLIIACLLSTAAAVSPAAADEQQRLQQLRGYINELRQGIGTDKQQLSKQQQQLNRLEKEIATANHRLRETEEQLKQQRHTQQALKTEVLGLTQKLEQEKRTLSQQLRASYTPSQQQTLKLLLNQSSPAEAGRTLAYYGYFSRAQLRTIEATRTSLDELQEANEKLQQSNDRLATLKQQMQQEQNKLSARQSEQKTLLAKLDGRIQGNEKNLSTMLADEQALTKLLRDLETKRRAQEAKEAKEAKEREKNSKTTPPEKTVPDPGKLKGGLQWPTQGKIGNSFGESRNQGQMTWQGVVIKGKEGQEVRTIAPGKVVFADWMRGYGLLLIVDHGNGLMSLYGQNRSLQKKTGDSVSNNETIATLGATENNDDADLYFEIRHKGKPVDPEKWLR